MWNVLSSSRWVGTRGTGVQSIFWDTKKESSSKSNSIFLKIYLFIKKPFFLRAFSIGLTVLRRQCRQRERRPVPAEEAPLHLQRRRPEAFVADDAFADACDCAARGACANGRARAAATRSQTWAPRGSPGGRAESARSRPCAPWFEKKSKIFSQLYFAYSFVVLLNNYFFTHFICLQSSLFLY